jgi:hypothetical protein
MGWTYSELRRQPARVVKRWMAMLAGETNALIKRQEVDQKMSEARARTRRN